MREYFALLGLHEDATKAEVKAAYERRVKKYRASDYDDDPEYVQQKLKELKKAYDIAYRAAGNGGSRYTRREDFDSPQKTMPSDEKAYHIPPRNEEEEHTPWKNDEDGGTVMRLPDGVKDTIRSAVKNSKEMPRNTKIAGIVIAVVIFFSVTASLFSIVAEVFNNDFDIEPWDSDVIFYEDEYDHTGDYDYSNEEDEEVAELAEEAMEKLLDEGEIVSIPADEEDWDYTTQDPKGLEREADHFAQLYLHMDSFSQVAAWVWDEYSAVLEQEDILWDEMNTEEQIDTILRFYGFKGFYEVGYYYKNPYDDELITDMEIYLRYINQFYEEEQ